MPTFKITVAYDGADFCGWQRQPSGLSIQGLLEDALRDLDQRNVTVIGAGRTDAGVHALAQVAAFTLEREIAPDALVRAMNVRLPDTVRVGGAEAVPPTFHPQFDSRSKQYRYRIWNDDVMSPFERRYAWHVLGELDVDAMQRAAKLLEGEHDFAAFQATDSDTKTTVRTIFSSEICKLKSEISYDVVGSGFLRHMVRNITGSLVDVGRRRFPVEWLSDVLASRDRTKAGRAAPPHGLFLVRVNYQ
ncbi:MAG TPA: tRNA pseudouridine(38-40) synthase TruA [Vicinamibacterales bacterium]|nr:tRNA pseudouridine(38-40) synthase TruA [Vicinamibacterales bacterium]